MGREKTVAETSCWHKSNRTQEDWQGMQVAKTQLQQAYENLTKNSIIPTSKALTAEMDLLLIPQQVVAELHLSYYQRFDFPHQLGAEFSPQVVAKIHYFESKK